MTKKRGKSRTLAALAPWIEARGRFRLSQDHVQMACELGMNPKKLEARAREVNAKEREHRERKSQGRMIKPVSEHGHPRYALSKLSGEGLGNPFRPRATQKFELVTSNQ